MKMSQMKTSEYYCWWLKSCTTWDVWNPINNGINYPSTGAGFQPSTVVIRKSLQRSNKINKMYFLHPKPEGIFFQRWSFLLMCVWCFQLSIGGLYFNMWYAWGSFISPQRWNEFPTKGGFLFTKNGDSLRPRQINRSIRSASARRSVLSGGHFKPRSVFLTGWGAPSLPFKDLHLPISEHVFVAFLMHATWCPCCLTLASLLGQLVAIKKKGIAFVRAVHDVKVLEPILNSIHTGSILKKAVF